MTQQPFARAETSQIQVLAPKDKLAYFDSQTVQLPRRKTPLQAWNQMNSHPMPVLKLAFKVRDAISSLFGVRRINGFSGAAHTDVSKGDMLDFFRVEHVSDSRLTLTERDSHLDVMICITSSGMMLTITASVQTHNRFGRVYMWPVGPAHKWIVRRMLKRLVADLSADPLI